MAAAVAAAEAPAPEPGPADAVGPTQAAVAALAGLAQGRELGRHASSLLVLLMDQGSPLLARAAAYDALLAAGLSDAGAHAAWLGIGVLRVCVGRGVVRGGGMIQRETKKGSLACCAPFQPRGETPWFEPDGPGQPPAERRRVAPPGAVHPR